MLLTLSGFSLAETLKPLGKSNIGYVTLTGTKHTLSLGFELPGLLLTTFAEAEVAASGIVKLPAKPLRDLVRYMRREPQLRLELVGQSLKIGSQHKWVAIDALSCNSEVGESSVEMRSTKPDTQIDNVSLHRVLTQTLAVARVKAKSVVIVLGAAHGSLRVQAVDKTINATIPIEGVVDTGSPYGLNRAEANLLRQLVGNAKSDTLSIFESAQGLVIRSPHWECVLTQRADWMEVPTTEATNRTITVDGKKLAKHLRMLGAKQVECSVSGGLLILKASTGQTALPCTGSIRKRFSFDGPRLLRLAAKCKGPLALGPYGYAKCEGLELLAAGA